VGETTSVAVRDGEDAVMIARAAVSQLITVGMGVGHRLPALHTALGRVLLAALDDNELDAFLDGVEPRVPTPQAVTDKRALGRIVRTVREEGYAYVDREAMLGYQSVAVPLRRWDGRVVAALNIGASTDRVDKATMLGPMLEVIRIAAAELRPQLI